MIFKRQLTLEELKEQAEKLGYRFVKKKEYVSFIPCICGNNKRKQLHHAGAKDDEDKVAFQCTKCGFIISGKTERDARIKWNETVRILEEN